MPLRTKRYGTVSIPMIRYSILTLSLWYFIAYKTIEYVGIGTFENEKVVPVLVPMRRYGLLTLLLMVLYCT